MNFKCKRCGKCCSNYLPLTENEIQEMKKTAKKENKHLLDKDWYNTCPFLNYKNECDIYENRPMICREYDCYKFKNCLISKNMIDSTRKEKYRLVDIRKEIFNNKRKEEE